MESPAEVNQAFDEITYGKTSAVLRMVEAYVGEDVFRAGVQTYLQKHAFGNATAEEFWDTLGTVSHRPVREIMQAFIDDPGVPLVTVDSRCEGDHT